VRPQLDLVEVAGVGHDGVVGRLSAAQHGIPGAHEPFRRVLNPNQSAGVRATYGNSLGGPCLRHEE
jgi:hypothetical protein